jgi:hypothetical protein
MLDRNKRIKPRPERFQTSNDKFDILVTCEERVYDQVIEGISNLFILLSVSHTLLEEIIDLEMCCTNSYALFFIDSFRKPNLYR